MIDALLFLAGSFFMFFGWATVGASAQQAGRGDLDHFAKWGPEYGLAMLIFSALLWSQVGR